MTLFGHSWQRRPIRRGCHSRQKISKADGLTLADISPGRQAKIIGFDSRLPADRHAHLQSYGLIPGYSVRVVQHSPVTIVRVEHLELALERELARQVKVSQ
jgi:Fe2+ transport system protein FeoA